MTNKVIHVAVGVITSNDGKICIAKRPQQSHQGGLWEFPGGKVDAGETITQALARELKEELAIDVLTSSPLIKIRHDYGDKSVLLDVHKVTDFKGQPIGNEGQPVQWVAPQELFEFDFPAANRPIIAAANLPQYWLITGDAKIPSDYLSKVESALQGGVRLVQFRNHNILCEEFLSIALKLASLCEKYSAQLQLNMSSELFLEYGKWPANVGLHMNSIELKRTNSRPINEAIWLSASCHNEMEILQARAINVDFICLSPVQKTATHPLAEPLGWNEFSKLAELASMPVYALGGLQSSDVATALSAGAQGVAGISAWWNS